MLNLLYVFPNGHIFRRTWNSAHDWDDLSSVRSDNRLIPKTSVELSTEKTAVANIAGGTSFICANSAKAHGYSGHLSGPVSKSLKQQLML